MTARASTDILVDASQVHAEGVLCGLKTALNILARTSGCSVPLSLRRKVTEWEANVIHYEWLAQQGRPVALVQSEQARSLIHLVLQRAGLEVLPDDC